MAGFLVLVAGLAGAIFAVPSSARLGIWIAVGMISTAAVVIGILRHRPRRQSAWWLVVAALGALTLGEVTHVPSLGFEWDGFPAVPDFIYLVIFVPLLTVGMWRLVRSGTPVLDRVGMLDVLLITTAAAAVCWGLLIHPLVSDPSVTFAETVVAGGYPVSGVLVLAIVLRLAVGIRLTMPVPWLLAGVLGMVLASAIYSMAQLQMEWRVEGPAMLGWLILFGGLGATALHPEMTQLTEPRALRPAVLTRSRLVTLAVAAFVAPAALLVEATRRLPAEIVIQRGLVLLLFLVVLARLYLAVDHQLRGSARERGMRCASADLVAATTTDQVAGTIRTAVRRLLPPGAPHEVVVEIGGTVVANGQEPGRRPPLVPARRVAASRGPSIHPLDPPLGDQPGIPAAVLRCPLMTPSASGDDGQIGALYVAADSPMLVELETSLEVVATQAAMALERITLTEQIRQHASEQYFRTLVHNAADVILIVEHDDTIRYASPSAATMLGVKRPLRLTDLVAPGDRPAVERTLRMSRAEPAAPVTADWTVLATDGSRLQAEAFCRDLRDDQTVAGLVITLRDVTEQRRLQRELTHLAYHDPLTGLANRSLLRERLERALDQRHPDGTVVGVLFLDVDDLKAVNDTLGHAAGDELLAETGRRLARAVRPPDTAARLGGDEFAALVAGGRSPQQVEEFAHELVASFVEPYRLAGRLVSRAVSVGVATTADAADADELLRQADQALYLAKNAGKAQVRRYGAARQPVPPNGRPPQEGQPTPCLRPGAGRSSDPSVSPCGADLDLPAFQRIGLRVGLPLAPDCGDQP